MEGLYSENSPLENVLGKETEVDSKNKDESVLRSEFVKALKCLNMARQKG